MPFAKVLLQLWSNCCCCLPFFWDLYSYWTGSGETNECNRFTVLQTVVPNFSFSAKVLYDRLSVTAFVVSNFESRFNWSYVYTIADELQIGWKIWPYSTGAMQYSRSVHTEPTYRLNFKPCTWFYQLPMRRAPLNPESDRDKHDGGCLWWSCCWVNRDLKTSTCNGFVYVGALLSLLSFCTVRVLRLGLD